MKIISLNTWCGRAGETIYDFFREHKDIDMFCLQEVDLDGTKFNSQVTHSDSVQGDPFLFKSIENLLEDHIGYFSPILDRWWGNAFFIKKELFRSISGYGEVLISNEQQKYMSYSSETCWFNRKVQWLDINLDKNEYTFVNIHGLWEKDTGKDDSQDRIEQSENILKFLNTKKDRKIILIGDFNLNPNTQSIKLLEKFGLRNLIKEYGITDTRTSFYQKYSRYADYALVSPEIKVKEFKVLPDEVSDHAPLYLELE